MNEIKSLSALREEIDDIDEELIIAIHKRMLLAEQIGRLKKEQSISVMQNVRIDHVIEKRIASSAVYGLNSSFIEKLWRELITEACRIQDDIISGKKPHL